MFLLNLHPLKAFFLSMEVQSIFLVAGSFEGQIIILFKIGKTVHISELLIDFLMIWSKNEFRTQFCIKNDFI